MLAINEFKRIADFARAFSFGRRPRVKYCDPCAVASAILVLGAHKHVLATRCAAHLLRHFASSISSDPGNRGSYEHHKTIALPRARMAVFGSRAWYGRRPRLHGPDGLAMIASVLKRLSMFLGKEFQDANKRGD